MLDRADMRPCFMNSRHLTEMPQTSGFRKTRWWEKSTMSSSFNGSAITSNCLMFPRCMFTWITDLSLIPIIAQTSAENFLHGCSPDAGTSAPSRNTAMHVPIDSSSGLDKVHFTWAGTFVLEALVYLFPDKILF